MKGIDLATLTETLVKVSPAHQAEPWNSFDGWEAAGPWAQKYAEARYVYPEGSPLPAFNETVRNMPLKTLARLSFDQLCKIKHSSFIMLDGTVCDRFERDADAPNHRLFHKIESSMWRWGMGRAKWNDVVDAFNGIRSFDLDIPGFEIRLDHTPSVNPRGHAEHTDTYLDGVFAYLIYYKGEHVMTLGFSIMDGRRVLIQQVQLKNRRGNRFLFRMPANRLEHFIARFRKAFPRHTCFIADGAEVAGMSLDAYQRGYEASLATIARYEARPHPLDKYDADYLEKQRANVVWCAEHMAHLKADLERLRAFYAASGRFRQKEALRVNSLTHYRLAA